LLATPVGRCSGVLVASWGSRQALRRGPKFRRLFRLPEAANATSASLERAGQVMRSESDEVLAVGTSLSLGLAMGLLLGGANRILVILALIPATAMGFTLFDRHGGTGTRSRV